MRFTIERYGYLENKGRRRFLECAIYLGMLSPFLNLSDVAKAQDKKMIIDDFSNTDLVSDLGTRWRGVSDQVMGGVSQSKVNYDTIVGRKCLRLRGDVRLDNNGGFIQAALDLDKSQGYFDATEYKGIRLVVYGNGEKYSVHLRTPDNTLPWQSYRSHFIATGSWTPIDLAFTDFEPYRTQQSLDISRLRRLGLVAIGREFSADLAVSEISFYG